MLTVTTAAGAHLAEQLEKAEAPEGTVVRLETHDRQWQMTLDEARPGDATVEHEEKPVLALDPAVNALLEPRTLDVEATPEGSKLKLF